MTPPIPARRPPAILHRGRRFVLALLALTAAAAGAPLPRVEIIWPTPNPAWAQGRGLADFLQDAGSGDPQSGAFGGVRNGGAHFHEGLDMKALHRDRHGEPTDEISAALNGVVRHVSASAGDSNYGRYVVLEHPAETPAVYTLYAHLSRIAPGLKPGEVVKRGAIIGTLGHSSGGYPIPAARAHLHFEIGLMVTENFEAWYERKKFGSKNDHGPWNGMNLMGFDPLDFLQAWRDHRVDSFQDYLSRLTPAVTVRIATRRVPDYIRRYPSLLQQPLPLGLVGGWEIQCNWTGLPFAWTPLPTAATAGWADNEVRLVKVNAELIHRERSKSTAVLRRGAWVPGHDLAEVLQQLFGVP